MIVTSDDAQKRSFLGVDSVLLSHGPESMVTKMLYMQQGKPPLHKRPNEQSGYVISGRYKLSSLALGKKSVQGIHTPFPATWSTTSRSWSRARYWTDFFSLPRKEERTIPSV